ncbi:MAG: type III pantothenate kinase [Gemmatimonadota bacterium]|nr:type III pantothenate kinase [Gemmatimonadota bacterium]
MLLALDVGNTEITGGLFAGDALVTHWRFTTVLERTPDEWAALLIAYLAHSGRGLGSIRAAVLGSVAPTVAAELASGIAKACGTTPVEVGPGSPLPITLDVDEPLTVGADRVVNTLAALTLYRRDTVVVDFGTATTFDCITGDGRFIGGVIAPGIRTGADNLIRRAAKLPATGLVAPAHVIGRRTETCIQAGVVLGAAESVGGLIRRIKAEWPGTDVPLVVATGGLAELIAPLVPEIEQTEPRLTLIGLRLAAGHLGLKW